MKIQALVLSIGVVMTVTALAVGSKSLKALATINLKNHLRT